MPPLARSCEARADTQRQQKLLGGQINLQEPAKDGVAPLSQSAVEHNIDLGLETEVASEASVTRGDRSALQILLRNLIDNALRYLPSGRPVTVAVGRDGAGAWLRVSDDGPGIPTFDREFRRFRRGEGEQAAGRSGSGLGLSLVQRIARLHDADVEPGRGLGDTGLGVTVRCRSA